MRYWDEFFERSGFKDGEDVPIDAWALRYVYVREINKLAKERRSKVRLVAYNRGGCHNPYLILTVHAKDVKKTPPSVLCDGTFVLPKGCDYSCNDQIMDGVIDAMMGLALESLVEINVSIPSEPSVECIECR